MEKGVTNWFSALIFNTSTKGRRVKQHNCKITNGARVEIRERGVWER